MQTILFFSRNDPLKPALAAALVRQQNVANVTAGVAVQEKTNWDSAGAKEFFAAMGLPWPDEILTLGAFELAPYDLVVCFTDRDLPFCPLLLGNPAIVLWNVPDPAGIQNSSAPSSCQVLLERISRLVEDLFGQGYFTALSHAKKNAELVLDNLHEGILAHDLNRRIFYFNQAAERITGRLRQEVIGRDCHEIFSERFCRSKCSFCSPGTEPSLRQEPYSLILRTKNAESKQIEMSLVGLKDYEGALVGVVGSFRDITREFDLAARLGEVEQFAGIIGRDPKLQEIFQAIRHLANSNASVLIQGESGTGKELVAAAIHNEGRRAAKPFLPVNCGALSESLLESELFGHVKGAFTGAMRDKKGLFEQADQGTIFLDEIGDISPAMQAKLLRVLQDGMFQRVGDEKILKVDIRVIAATHKDLRKEIVAGRFREDLYYRLCVVPLDLPALRSRREDIPLLVRHFLHHFALEEKRDEPVFTPEAMDLLKSYHWPGNIRELQNIIRYTLVHCRGSVITPQHLPGSLFKECLPAAEQVSAPRKRGKLEMAAVLRAIEEAKGNRVVAARRLGVGRATLYRFLDKNPLETSRIQDQG